MLRKMRYILLCFVLLLVGVATPSVRATELPKFSLSVTSGVAGSQFTVSHVDSCPATDFTHETYAWVTFFDTSGGKIENYTLVEKDGSWSSSVRFEVPHRTVNRYDTSEQYDGPALGTGRVEVRCTVPYDPSSTSMTYQSQPFTITAQAPEFTLSASKVAIESIVRISSQQPCPSGMPDVHVLVANAQVAVGLDVKVDEATRHWVADVYIPKTVSDPMMGDKPFPIGKSVVSVWCYGQGTQYYGDQILEVKDKPIRMVALGDSYSSGVGTFKYYNTGNGCHRSELGYPPYVAKKFGHDNFTFAACSGAVTDDFYVANPKNANEPAQLNRLTEDTELVTLTIGGNDAGFEEVLKKCIKGIRIPPQPTPFGWGCSDNDALKTYVKKRLKALGGDSHDTFARPIHSLLDVYRKIAQAAPRAHIYVGGYPELFSGDKAYYHDYKPAPSKKVCQVADNTYSVDFKDALWINKQADLLNGVIERQVNKAKAEGVAITYVQPLFGGHRLCDKYEPWLNELLLDDDFKLMAESFHPKSIGYQLGYGIEFNALIK